MCFFLQIIFKMGDDVRQDQLIVQMISLMDRLLKKENLDLKLSPYKVLATSKDTGMIECVPNSKNIADVLAEYDKDLRKYIKHHNPDPHADYGIKPAALNNFVRSSGTLDASLLAQCIFLMQLRF
jgi:phosphatidylinositol 3-kinase